MNNLIMRHKNIFVPLLIFVFAIVIRLYRIDTPPVDAHAWRQAATSGVALNYVIEDGNIFHPRQNEFLPANNFERYFFLEFPFYEYTTSLGYRVFGIHYWVPRIISVLASAFTATFIYLLSKLLFSSMEAGITSGVLFSIFPVSYFFGRATITDMTGLIFFTVFLYLLIMNIQKNYERYYIFGSICLSIAALIKPYYFIYSPLILFSLLYHKKYFTIKIPELYQLTILIGLIIFNPFLLWVAYYRINYPIAIPNDHMYGLLGFSNVNFIDFIKTMLTDRFSYTLFTTVGFILSVLGMYLIFIKPIGLFINNIYRKLILLWLLLLISYLFIIASGNIEHQYYQLPFVPIACVFATRFIIYLKQVISDSIKTKRTWKLITTLSVVIICISIFCIQSIQINKRWFNVEIPYYLEIPIAQQLIPQNSRILVTGYFRNPTFLDLSARHGWVINSEYIEMGECPNEKEYRGKYETEHGYITKNSFSISLDCYVYPFLKSKQKLGAKYFVVLRKELPISFSELNHELNIKSKPIYSSKQMIIYDLRSFKMTF
jgi:4-amino-4-deoxy-L-arabinose transferase-like glycosyltransferase